MSSAWGQPSQLIDIDTQSTICGAQPSISGDKMTLYYSKTDDCMPNGQFFIWWAKRDPLRSDQKFWSVQGKYPTPTNGSSIGVNDPNSSSKAPSISVSNTLLYFDVTPWPETGTHDIYHVWQTDPNQPFGARVKDVTLSDASMDDIDPDISSDYNYMVLTRQTTGSGGHPRDLDVITVDGVWIASRDLTPPLLWPPKWCAPQQIALSDDSQSTDKAPCIVGNTILFRSTRPNGSVKSEIWQMVRSAQ